MDLKKQGPAMAVWALAILLPICILIWWGDNLNERSPILAFLICPALCGVAAYLTMDSKKGIYWSLGVGLIYACAINYLV